MGWPVRTLGNNFSALVIGIWRQIGECLWEGCTKEALMLYGN